jgi:hypothetical protein
MNKLIIFSILLCSIESFSQNVKNYYVGLERNGISYENEKIFHKNHLLILNDSIYLYKEPIIITNNDTIFSASDGAFYYFRGKLIEKENQLFVELKLMNCDYCILESIDDLNKIYSYKTDYLLNDSKLYDKIIFNNVEYRLQKFDSFPIKLEYFNQSYNFEESETKVIEFIEQ